jgi:hypothetical protein
MRRRSSSTFRHRGSRRRKLIPLVITGMLVPAVLALVVATIFILPGLKSHAATAVNGNCALIVPSHPLTAKGLATPYQLVAADAAAANAAGGPCNEANAMQTAFVQAAILNPATGTVAIYDPLVVDKGMQPAIAPIVPKLPQGAIIGIWFGFNGNNLTLQDSNGSLQEGHCVNGIGGSIFGQFSYCNAPTFFQAANAAIAARKLVPPSIGKARDGLPCPTVRDFSLVDQDQSDNVTTMYLANANGQLAQMTAANIKALPNAQKLFNGSDNGLLDFFVDPSLGCTPWMVPNLADAGNPATALPLDELQAAAQQAQPVALVPTGDPMVLLNGNASLDKTNAYRAGVDQPMAQTLTEASTRIYCTNLLAIAPQRLLLDAHLTKVFSTPDAAAANSLFTFLAQRFVTSYGANGLNCTKLLGQPDPVSVKTDSNGVAIDATINGTTVYQPINCAVNGTVLAGCSGTILINGQACSFTFDKNTRQVDITCPMRTPPQQ